MSPFAPGKAGMTVSSDHRLSREDRVRLVLVSLLSGAILGAVCGACQGWFGKGLAWDALLSFSGLEEGQRSPMLGVAAMLPNVVSAAS